MLNEKQLRETFKKESKEIFEDYFTFLRFPSISTDPKHHPDILACAEWLKNYLTKIGLTVELWPTKSAPVLFAHDLRAGPDKETLLLYCHYDVQPVDPLELWTTPPFTPTIREGKVFARGAVDNKGQCFYTIRALKTILESSKPLPFNLKFIIEGEEESGSAGLAQVLSEKKQQLKADHLLIVDSGLRAPKQPGVSLGCRGLVCMTVTLKGSSQDMHSGTMGGVVYNPNRALVELLALLHDKNGKVTVPGFYDSVSSLSEKEKKQYAMDFDYHEAMEAKATGTIKGVPPGEAATLYPTLEINGISGGYAGPGFKTVIPALAQAKISCRLVPDQDPLKIGESVKKFLEQHVPGEVDIEVEIHEGMGAPFRTAPNSRICQLVAEAYTTVFQKPCEYILMGGSIPIATQLAETAGAEPVLMGMGLATDKIHAPDEHFDLDRFEDGYVTLATLLQLLG